MAGDLLDGRPSPSGPFEGGTVNGVMPSVQE